MHSSTPQSQSLQAALDFPLDSAWILRKKKALKRELLEKDDLINKKIAILGGTTTFEIKEQLELFLLNCGIKPEFYECEFGQYYEAVMFGQTGLFEFKPDFVYIHVSIENLKSLIDVKKLSKEKAEEGIWKA